MRPLFRRLAPVLAAAALVALGSSTALASATPSSASLDANFCVNAGATLYCYDIDGTIRYLDTAAGSSVSVNKLTRTTAYQGGVVVGDALSTSTSRTVFQADGSIIVQSTVHTQSDLGDEPCTYRMVLRLVDYEAVVYEVTSTCS